MIYFVGFLLLTTVGYTIVDMLDGTNFRSSIREAFITSLFVSAIMTVFTAVYIKIKKRQV